MSSFFDFFDTSRFPARWGCGNWPDYLGWIHVISDLITFAAYITIPLVIIAYVRRRPEVPFSHVFWLFCAFIFSCGTVHLIEAIIFWYPIYPVSALVKALTALVSTAAVVATFRILPRALALPALATVNAQLAENERRLEAAQEDGHIGDWSYHPREGTIRWSRQVFRLFQRDPTLGPPKTMEENAVLYTEKGLATLNAAMARATEDKTRQEVDLEVQLPDGSTAWHRSTIHAEYDGKNCLSYWWGTVQDQTESVSLRHELEQQRSELQRNNRDLTHFTTLAAHDLLEPLRKAKFFSEMLKEDLGSDLQPAPADTLLRLERAVDRMQRIVRGLQALSRVGRHRLANDHLTLDDALDDALETLDEQIRETSTQVERVNKLPSRQGDRALLSQVFQNLIANAIRYAKPGQAPHITISSQHDDQQVTVTVADRGIGFDASFSERIFAPFVRLAGASGEGIGIGLSLCQRIIEVHGGEIRAESVPGQGTRIHLIFPRGEATTS